MVRNEDEKMKMKIEIIRKMLENFLFNKHVSAIEKKTRNQANFMQIFTEKWIEEFINSKIAQTIITDSHKSAQKQY